MSDRCEPPPELRGVDGWHWVQSQQDYCDNGPECAFWFAPTASTIGGRGWWNCGATFDTYLAPVATPAEVEALRARAADHDLRELAVPKGNNYRANYGAARLASVASLPPSSTVLMTAGEVAHLARMQVDLMACEQALCGRATEVATLRARVGRLEEALRDLLALPVGVGEIKMLDRGIGTSTPQAAWLRARTALEQTP